MAKKFTIRSAKTFATKLTARIQKTGRLGFGEKESELMNLRKGVYVGFASCEEDVAVTHIVIKSEKDDDSFELKKGETKYPFVETKQLFDYFGLDYLNQSIFFDLTRDEEFDSELMGEVYHVHLRIKEKNNNTEDNGEDITE